MSQQDVIIDKLNIHLPNGWQGDAVYLARKISEQIQRHADQLQSTQQLDLKLSGNFSGVTDRVTQPLSLRLKDACLLCNEENNNAIKKHAMAGVKK